MASSTAMIREFLTKLGHQIPPRPDTKLMTKELCRVWAKIFLEEALELVDGLGVQVRLGGYDLAENFKIAPETFSFTAVRPINIIETVDGAADSEYVAKAICELMGVCIERVVEEVCQNNLDKFGPGSVFKDGKLQKPPGHPKPDIVGELKAQGWPGETPVPTVNLAVTPSEFDTILAALRYYQSKALQVNGPLSDLPPEIAGIACGNGDPLTNTDIDSLCQRING